MNDPVGFWPLREASVPYASYCGVDIERVFEEARVGARFEQAKAMDGRTIGGDGLGRPPIPAARTRSGKLRSSRIRECGKLYLARRGSVWGLTHICCRDRCCTRCGRIRARKLAAQLEEWMGRVDGTLIFATLTQYKLDVLHESCATAVARASGTWRDVWNSKSARGRAMLGSWVGGVRFLEVTWSPRGMRASGHWVEYDGWHAHYHCILEVRRGCSVSGAVRRLSDDWKLANPECVQAGAEVWSPLGHMPGLDFQHATAGDAAQCCKYALKPFETADPYRAREAATSLADTKAHTAFGKWRSWVSETVREPDEKTYVAWDNLGSLRHSAATGGSVLLERPIGGGAFVRELYPAAHVEAYIRRDARTFQQRSQDARAERLAKQLAKAG